MPTAQQIANPAQSLEAIVQSKKQLADNAEAGAITTADFAIADRALNAQRDTILQAVQAPDDQPRPWTILGSSPDSRYGRFAIVPKSVEIEKNGYRVADTAKVTIDWRTLPFDPRIVRAAAIELVVGVVAEDPFVKGFDGQTDPVSGLPLSIIQQSIGSPTVTSATRFCGWTDEWAISFDEENLTELTCRDYTSSFIDTPLGSDAMINLDLPIDQGIATMLKSYPTLDGFQVRYIGVPGYPAPAPSLGPTVPRTARSRRGRNARSGRSGDQRMTVWDHITDTCVALGLVPFVVNYELHIVQPTTQYRTQDVRRMVYGRNLTTLSFTRKLGGTKVPTIECRAYDPTIGRVRWSRWPVRTGEPTSGVLGVTQPPMPLRANEVTPSGARPDERIQTYTLKPTTSPAIMSRCARALFEQIGRQEIEGELETSDVSSWDISFDEARDVLKADLLDLKSGDALELLVAPRESERPEVVATTPGEWIGMERAARTRFLMSQGMTRQVAENIAGLQDAVSSMIFRVSDVHLVFDSEDGIKVKASFMNFIEVRELASTSGLSDAGRALVAPSSAALDAARATDLEEVVKEVLLSSVNRIAATQEAAAAERYPALPVSGALSAARISQMVDEEAALASIGRED
jgi:hypothetical protein